MTTTIDKNWTHRPWIRTKTNRRLPKGTWVVSHEDGEPGHIVSVCSYRRNGVDAWSYVVKTQYGEEVWEVGELFVPEAQD